MNDVDVSRQIQQMVRFIRQEAEEKANEISVSAEEEFNIEKLQIVEAEKKKIRQEYERKEKQVDVRKKIFRPTVMDSVVNNARKLNVPIAQVATLLGQPTVNPNAPCAQGVKVVGHSHVNPKSVDLTVVGQLAVCAQGATFEGQQAVNLNPSGAQELGVNPDAPGVQVATVLGQPTVNPNAPYAQGAKVVVHSLVNPSVSVDLTVLGRLAVCAQGATFEGQQPVNLNPSGAQGAMVLGQQAVNPDPLGAHGAMIVGTVEPNLSGAQGAMIVGHHAVNPDTISVQQATVVGDINPSSYDACEATIVGQQAPCMLHISQVYPVVPTTLVLSNHAEKPEKFDGSNFTCWQQKMLFYLTTLNLSRFIKEEGPAAKSSQQTQMVVDAWNNSDYLCKNYVLNCLVDSLYDMYSSKKTSKELWDSLDHYYGTKYAGAKICIVGQFLDYKMVDSKTVISQVQELQVIIHEIHAKGMVMCESFQVAAIIEKLPYGWIEFKNRLKHKRNEMSMEELILRLHIEENNKRSRNNFSVVFKENIVKKGCGIKLKKKNTGKVANNVEKGSKMGPKGKIWRTRNFQRKCFNF